MMPWVGVLSNKYEICHCIDHASEIYSEICTEILNSSKVCKLTITQHKQFIGIFLNILFKNLTRFELGE